MVFACCDSHGHARTENTVNSFPTEQIIHLNNNSDICSQVPRGGRVSCHEAGASQHTLWFNDLCQSEREDGYFRP